MSTYGMVIAGVLDIPAYDPAEAKQSTVPRWIRGIVLGLSPTLTTNTLRIWVSDERDESRTDCTSWLTSLLVNSMHTAAGRCEPLHGHDIREEGKHSLSSADFHIPTTWLLGSECILLVPFAFSGSVTIVSSSRMRLSSKGNGLLS